MPEITTFPVAEIKIGKRFRRDLGDVAALSASIDGLGTEDNPQAGLLQPVVITPAGRLIAGARRLEAVKLLGWDQVPVRITENMLSATDELIAERDENTCRLPMKPSELVTLGLRLEELEAPRAEQRKRATYLHGSLPGGKPIIGKALERGPETRQIVGNALGVSGGTYQRMKAIVLDAKSEDPYIRTAAEIAIEEMDRTGKIKPAYARVQRARAKEAEPGKFATWDKSSERYKDKATKIVEGCWASLNRFDSAAPALAETDMEVLTDNLSSTEFDDMLAMTAKAITSLKAFQRSLKDHKPASKETA